MILYHPRLKYYTCSLPKPTIPTEHQLPFPEDPEMRLNKTVLEQPKLKITIIFNK